MFESLALENPRNFARRWTTALSFALEAAAIGLLILIPLGYTEGISLRIGEPLVAPAGTFHNLVTSQPKPLQTHSAAPSLFREGVLVYGGKIPKGTHPIDDSKTGGPASDSDSSVPYGVGDPGPNPLLRNLLNDANAAPHVVGPTVHPTILVSHLDPGMLIRRVQPTYPRPAQIAHVEGSVVLAALIDTQGRITQLHTLSGHPLLIPAAIDAVQQWRYRPYILNGAPMEVETQITVVFTLQH